jgi:hypothetical protein
MSYDFCELGTQLWHNGMTFLFSIMPGASAGRIKSGVCSNLKAYPLTWLVSGELVGSISHNAPTSSYGLGFS